jgi:hypothetical protein
VRGFVRTLLTATAAVMAAVVSFTLLTLPRRAVLLDGALPETSIPGAFHVHTVRSDGTGTLDEIAAAAARAGLRFVVFADHGDGTRVPEPPAYRHGVLCLDAVEINTSDGHLVAVGLDAPTPYPLAGRAEEVLADIHRFGGTAVLAHPDSPRPDLRWGAPGLPFDGIEWLNADSEWRDETSRTLIASGLRAIVRAPETMAALFTRPGRTLRRWDSAARTRPIFGVAALDAHARIPWGEDEEPREGTALAWPSYESMFRTLVQTLVLDAPLSGDAGADAIRVLEALTGGRSFSTVRALAWPAAFDFSATAAGITARMGDRIPDPPPAPFVLQAAVANAPGTRLTLWRDGVQIATGRGELTHAAEAGESGVYRVEVSLPDASVPWIVSNPIVIGRLPGPPDGTPGDSTEPEEWLEVSRDNRHWVVEKDPTSTGSAEPEADAVRLEYALGDGPARGQYAALAAVIDAPAGVDRVTFVGRSDRPVRVSVQVRLPGPGPREPRRWRRSVYLDDSARSITLRLQDFEPVDGGTTRRPIVVPIQSLLFVVDTVNSAPGSQGRVWISDVRLGLDRLD